MFSTLKTTTMEYLFYHIYFNIKKLPTNPAPGLSALVYLSLLQFLNILTIILVLNPLLQLNLKAISFDKLLYFSLFFCCILLIINYIFLYKRLNRIKKKFGKDNKFKRIIGIIVFVSYSLLSITLICLIASKFPLR